MQVCQLCGIRVAVSDWHTCTLPFSIVTIHPQHCPECKKALGRIDAVLPLLAALSVALLGAAAFALITGAAPPTSGRVLGAAAGGALAAVLRAKLAGVRALFVFTDYVHAEKN